MSEQIGDRSRLYFPGLQSFYSIAVLLSYVFMRFCLGLSLIQHGCGKLFGDDIPHMAPIALSYLVGCIEFFGGLMLAAGFFTRVVAAMIAVEMAVISFLVLWLV